MARGSSKGQHTPGLALHGNDLQRRRGWVKNCLLSLKQSWELVAGTLLGGS